MRQSRRAVLASLATLPLAGCVDHVMLHRRIRSDEQSFETTEDTVEIDGETFFFTPIHEAIRPMYIEYEFKVLEGDDVDFLFVTDSGLDAYQAGITRSDNLEFDEHLSMLGVNRGSRSGVIEERSTVFLINHARVEEGRDTSRTRGDRADSQSPDDTDSDSPDGEDRTEEEEKKPIVVEYELHRKVRLEDLQE